MTAFGEPAMGTRTALDQTRDALGAAGWTVRLGSAHPDLDTIDDLGELADRLAADGRSAPRTAEWARCHRAVIVLASGTGTMDGPASPKPEEPRVRS